MPENKPPNTEPQVSAPKSGYSGKPALWISLGVIALVTWLGYDYYKERAANAASSTPQPNQINQPTATTPLTLLSPVTQIQGATNDTEVYPTSVTDQGGLTLDDFNYGISTTPQEPGEQGITYKQYQELIG